MEPTAPVFEIQRFSIHDGPGIRTLIFLKGCALHCPWCQNPESQASRPIIAFYGDRCREGFECVAACPKGAITLGRYRVDHRICDRCTRCVDACAYSALRLIGEHLTPHQLMVRIMVDAPYHERSGGGVTFTGGEPTLYPSFMARVLELCTEAGIHTNLETAGTFSWQMWERTLGLLDLIYFDLKILDRELHERHLGGRFATIVENASKLTAKGFPVEFRMAMVPGYTDTSTNIAAVVAFLHELGHDTIHLLPYHNMGEVKIDIIQGNQPKLGLDRYSEKAWHDLVRTFEVQGIGVLGRSI